MEALEWVKESVTWVPHSYQKKAVKFLLEHACAALFLDPGLGKTSITMAAIKMLKKKGLIDKVLLIAPLRVCHLVWPAEAKKWKDFSGLKIEVLHGPKKAEALAREADIYVINPEGLDWLLGVTKTKTAAGKTKVVANLRQFKSYGFDTLVIDELSKFKHPNTSRFKGLKQVLNTFARRWGLTGSPASNGLLDLFGQAYMLDMGNALGPYITKYRSDYFKTIDKMGFVWVPQDGAEERIYEHLAPLALRMSAEDYLELPTLVENNIRVDLPPKVMEFYLRMEEDLIAQMDDETLVAATAAAASMKCRQISNGGIYLDPEVTELLKAPKSKREWLDLHTAKLDALEDLIEELQGSPLLVAYDFAHDLSRLQGRFGKDLPYIGGGVSTARSKELEALWNVGKLPVLFGHPQAMAHGLNLQEAGNHVAWHSLTWDFELYDQLIRRIHRQGNTSKKIFVHHIMARGTIDEAILWALKSKNKGQQALFEALKQLAKTRK